MFRLERAELSSVQLSSVEHDSTHLRTQLGSWVVCFRFGCIGEWIL